MAPPKRRAEPTHPTVWIGLALALGGLLLAVYAYTGPRVYDILYFFLAIFGGILSLAGILVSAWGRALGAARRQRAARETRSGAPEKPAAKPREVPVDLPTQAAPSSKKSFADRFKRGERSAKPVFAFKRPPPPASEGPAPGGVATALVERLTLSCPECEKEFTAEGERPFEAKCPQCGFASTI